MKIGYIYALYYNGEPFYIGQTTRTLKKRFADHRSKAKTCRDMKLVNVFMRKVSNASNFYDVISMRLLCECEYCDLNYMEMKYVKYCIDRCRIIYNNCDNTTYYKLDRSSYLSNKLFKNI